MIDVEKYTTINYKKLYRENKTEKSPSYPTFKQRLKEGWTIDAALLTPSKHYGRVRKADEYAKWREVAKTNGTGRRLYEKRVVAGWSYEKAATQERRTVKKVKNQTYDSVQALLKAGYTWDMLKPKYREYIKSHPDEFPELMGGS